MWGSFLPECEEAKVKEAVLDMVDMLESMGPGTYKIGLYRFRYIIQPHHQEGIYAQLAMTVSRRSRRLRCKPIMKYTNVSNIETFRVRNEEIWLLADAYRELTEHYEDWKHAQKARQQTEEELAGDMFEEFGPPRERME